MRDQRSRLHQGDETEGLGFRRGRRRPSGREARPPPCPGPPRQSLCRHHAPARAPGTPTRSIPHLWAGTEPSPMPSSRSVPGTRCAGPRSRMTTHRPISARRMRLKNCSAPVHASAVHHDQSLKPHRRFLLPFQPGFGAPSLVRFLASPPVSGAPPLEGPPAAVTRRPMRAALSDTKVGLKTNFPLNPAISVPSSNLRRICPFPANPLNHRNPCGRSKNPFCGPVICVTNGCGCETDTTLPSLRPVLPASAF
jgi:hypothetical protein